MNMKFNFFIQRLQTFFLFLSRFFTFFYFNLNVFLHLCVRVRYLPATVHCSRVILSLLSYNIVCLLLGLYAVEYISAGPCFRCRASCRYISLRTHQPQRNGKLGLYWYIINT